MRKITKWQARKQAKQDKMEDFKAREKQKQALALESSIRQEKAIEKHCFKGISFTSNYGELTMNNALKSWRIRRDVKKVNEEIRLMSSLASESDKIVLSDKIIDKSIAIAKKVDKYNEKAPSWEKQSLSREIRDTYKPMKQYDNVVNNENASEKEKREANNVFQKKMDNVLQRIIDKH